MHRLLSGFRQFHHQLFPQRAAHFQELASGQQPSTLFITCSDSRIMPHLLTQTEPGELFVLRNAGNLVPPYTSAHGGEAATIEYAVKALKVQEIVVCGHSHCGAITGVLQPELVREMPAVQKWLEHADKVRQEINDYNQPTGCDEDVLTTAIKVNVLLQLDNLRTYPAVADAVSSGTLSLYGWFYRFETGEVTMFDDATGKFVSALHVATEPSVA